MAHGKPGDKCCNPVQEHTSEGIISNPSLTEVIEKKRFTHNLPSDAEHASSHDTGQAQFLRIGQWPSRITPELATPFIALETHSAIRRTGTDLRNEEISIGTAHSRIYSDEQTHSDYQHEYGDVSVPHNTTSYEHSAVFEDRGQDPPHDYYQFEWFRLLIGMVLAMVSGVIIFVLILVVYGATMIVIFWKMILISVAIGVSSLLLYTGIFVLLMEYNEAIENCLNRYARLRPALQHACLRLCAYIYALGVIAVLSVWMIETSGLA